MPEPTFTNDVDDVVERVIFGLEKLMKDTLPKAVVIPSWVVGAGVDAAVADFRSAAEDEFDGIASRPLIHGYCIGVDGLDDRQDDDVANKRFVDSIILKVWGFYTFVKGNRAKNSEHVFVRNLMKLRNAVSRTTQFQTPSNPNGIVEIKTLHHLNFPEIVHGRFSAHGVNHVAQGSLKVDVRLHL